MQGNQINYLYSRGHVKSWAANEKKVPRRLGQAYFETGISLRFLLPSFI